uniref:glutathione-specific gamma-glutamylcyclotransferase n=1 Tax=Aureoumbra lagunensis TaxID=44058 RepID=A0A7S3JR24_9STRA
MAASKNDNWDPEKRVFRLNKAATPEGFEIPNPLYIFGYASLVWKPDAGWENFEARMSTAQGWTRRFAQLSTDHRGTPESPGLVCTMLPTQAVKALGYEPDMYTRGKAYRIPDDCVENVLEALDFREKGGYTRDLATIKFDDDGSEQKALIYSATIDNPNFVPELASHTSSALEKAATLIAHSHGPSGPNREYLLKLADVLPEDPYLAALAHRVRSILDPLSGDYSPASITADLLGGDSTSIIPGVGLSTSPSR